MTNHPNRSRHLYAIRRDAVLYLAWEYGIKRANELMRTLPRDEFGRIDLAPAIPALGQRRGRRERAIARVNNAVAYQQGRLGRPAFNHAL